MAGVCNLPGQGPLFEKRIRVSSTHGLAVLHPGCVGNHHVDDQMESTTPKRALLCKHKVQQRDLQKSTHLHSTEYACTQCWARSKHTTIMLPLLKMAWCHLWNCEWLSIIKNSTAWFSQKLRRCAAPYIDGCWRYKQICSRYSKKKSSGLDAECWDEWHG